MFRSVMSNTANVAVGPSIEFQRIDAGEIFRARV
jgi:hypothetical protein